MILDDVLEEVMPVNPQTQGCSSQPASKRSTKKLETQGCLAMWDGCFICERACISQALLCYTKFIRIKIKKKLQFMNKLSENNKLDN